jgi:hypothetical protein
LTDRIKSVHIHTFLLYEPKRLFIGFNDSIFMKDAKGQLLFFGVRRLKTSANYVYESTRINSGKTISYGYDIISPTLKGEESLLLSKVNGAYEWD